MDIANLTRLNAARRKRVAALHITALESGQNWVLCADDTSDELDATLLEQAWAMQKPGLLAVGSEQYFINTHWPAPEIVVIGAGHIGQVLVPMAKLAGFVVRVIDPRQAFATVERFPDCDLDHDWPQDALQRRPLDAYCALVALTHDPKIDDIPLALALKAKCFYIGALGSRKTHATRLERLQAYGCDRDSLTRIHGPVGLSIGAKTPAEIAVSILAEIVQTYRHGV